MKKKKTALEDFQLRYLNEFNADIITATRAIISSDVTPLTDKHVIPSQWRGRSKKPLHHIYCAPRMYLRYKVLTKAVWHASAPLLCNRYSVTPFMMTPSEYDDALRELNIMELIHRDTSHKGFDILTPNYDSPYNKFDWEDMTYDQVETLCELDPVYSAVLKKLMKNIINSSMNDNVTSKPRVAKIKVKCFYGPGRTLPLLWLRACMVARMLGGSAEKFEGALIYEMQQSLTEWRQAIRQKRDVSLVQFCLENMTHPDRVSEVAKQLRLTLEDSLLKFDKPISFDDPWYLPIRMYNDYYWQPTRTMKPKQ